MARDQVKEGAHVLDVCVDYVGHDGTVDMEQIAARFATQAALPLVFDSTEPQVMETGLAALRRQGDPQLRQPRGRRARGLAPRPRVHAGPRVRRRPSSASRSTKRARPATPTGSCGCASGSTTLATEKYGIDPTDLIFDMLTFPLGSGQDELRRDGIETIEAIRRAKTELPGSSTILGLSNVSFGLKPAIRHVLNSVFLHECREAGLDAAIAHAARIIPMHKIDDRRPRGRARPHLRPAHATATTRSRAARPLRRRGGRRRSNARTVRAGRSRSGSKHRIIDGERDGIEAELDEAHRPAAAPALSIINDVLLEGMKVVGELFGRGEMQLPFVLQSAETMKTAVAYLEPHLEKADAGGKGVVVIGTVKGDVHDIGKNLVDIILTNNGYEVHNIGIKAPLQTFVDKAKEVDADAIGMSGLLVKSTIIMRENLLEMNDARPRRRCRCSSAARRSRATTSRSTSARCTRAASSTARTRSRGSTPWTPSWTAKTTGTIDPDFGRAPGGRKLPPRKSAAARRGRRQSRRVPTSPPTSRSSCRRSSAHAWRRASRSTRSPATSTRPRCSATSGSSGPRAASPTTSSRRASDPRCAPSSIRRSRDGWLVPAVAWGYFPVNAEGNDLIVWTDDDRRTERCRFQFPRQRKDRFLCISDFFRPVESGDADYAGFHVVTVGSDGHRTRTRAVRGEPVPGVPPVPRALGGDDRGARRAVALAASARSGASPTEDGPSLAGLFRQKYRGSRYSWGYPACPDLEDQAKLVDLLEVDRIGVVLTEEFQLEPEQSTSAIIVPHPEAKYFVV